jgi:3-phenylpropionate/cinnamic acid dioxygenase small subunit
MGPSDSTLRRLSDRAEIDDLLTRYATAIDGRDWDLLDDVFTPDARLDYRSAGGIAGPYPEVKRWLAEVLPMFRVTQHLVLNRSVELDGDRARSRAQFLNPNEATIAGEPWIFTVGGTYHDELARTAAGWRITRRVEETLWWDHALPGLSPTPPPLPEPLDF